MAMPIDSVPQNPEFLAAGVASGVGALFTLLSNTAIQVVGQPLPVVLAAAAGACVARSYAPTTGFWRALLITSAWALISCAAAPLAASLLQSVAHKLGADLALPTNAMAGIAAVIALAPMWWPQVWPWLRGFLPQQKGGPNAS